MNEQGIKTRSKILHLNRWITKVDASDTIVYDDDDAVMVVVVMMMMLLMIMMMMMTTTTTIKLMMTNSCHTCNVIMWGLMY